MTNEQLAALIKHGGADELTPILWERVRNLVYTLCDKYYAAYSSRFVACGVERDDLKQESYFAFLKAISSFNESSGLLFSSYLEYPVKNTGAELLGIRNAMRCNRKPLDNCKSLNESLPSSDGDELCYIDTISDETAEQAFEQALKRVSDKYFKEEAPGAAAKRYSCQIINDNNCKDMFKEIIRQMDMSYSYKPMLKKGGAYLRRQ